MPDSRLLLLGQMSWNFSLMAALICLVCCYGILVLYYAKSGLARRETILFSISILLFYLTVGSPFGKISHLSFSLHMIQMSILFFIIPPLVLLGIPDKLFLKLTTIPKLSGIKKLRFPPTIALYLFAVVLLLYHLPFILTYLSKNAVLQNGFIGSMFLLSFVMWWPIAAPDPNRRLNKLEMKRYAMISGYVLLPACLFFIFAAFIGETKNPLFAQLTVHLCLPATSNAITPPFNTKYDQFLAGIVMMGLHKCGLLIALALERKTVVSQDSTKRIVE